MFKKKSCTPSGARTSLFMVFKYIVRIAKISHQQKSNVEELIELDLLKNKFTTNRRKFIKGSGIAALSSILPLNYAVAKNKNMPSIAIVGAGLAGLTTAYELRKAGVKSEIYEASHRTGGRAFTHYGLLGKNSFTELGGEFIDSDHEDLITLVEELGLELAERKVDNSKKIAYYFEGQHYTFEQIIEAFKPLIEQIIAVDDSIDDDIDYQHEANASKYDNMSLAKYLDTLGVKGWLRHFIECAYITEYGLDPEQQSCLNFIFMLVGDEPDELRENFQIFGISDERYRIEGGVTKLCEILAGVVSNQINTEHELVAIDRKNQQYKLSFLMASGKTKEVLADIVVVTIPFSVLRDVKLNLELPTVKRKSINELGYGTNIKIVLSTPKRHWLNQGYSGELFSDGLLQLLWDNSETQSNVSGGLTFFYGGSLAEKLATQSLSVTLPSVWSALDKAFPGLASQGYNNPFIFSWPNYRFSKGSYACYKVGQWTSIGGAENQPVDRLFFAGEHCSYEHQGMMNGAVESGKKTAISILRQFSLGEKDL